MLTDDYWSLTASKLPVVNISFRCRPAPDFSAASVSNAAGIPPIERQLYGTSKVKIFLLPASCRPWVPATGRLQVSL